MPKYVIERDVPGAGSLSEEQLREISLRSIQALGELGPRIQWIQSYVTDNKLYCVYLAAGRRRGAGARPARRDPRGPHLGGAAPAGPHQLLSPGPALGGEAEGLLQRQGRAFLPEADRAASRSRAPAAWPRGCARDRPAPPGDGRGADAFPQAPRPRRPAGDRASGPGPRPRPGRPGTRAGGRCPAGGRAGQSPPAPRGRAPGPRRQSPRWRAMVPRSASELADAPSVLQGAEGVQGLAVEGLRGVQVALLAGHVTLVVDGPGVARAVAQPVERSRRPSGRAPAPRRSRPWPRATKARFETRAGEARLVAELLPQPQALLQDTPSLLVFAEPGRIGSPGPPGPRRFRAGRRARDRSPGSACGSAGPRPRRPGRTPSTPAANSALARAAGNAWAPGSSSSAPRRRRPSARCSPRSQKWKRPSPGGGPTRRGPPPGQPLEGRPEVVVFGARTA